MLIATCYDAVEIHRVEKFIYGRFLRPHRVIGTCRAAGGLRDDLTHVYNHQVCEPSGPSHNAAINAWEDPIAYRRLVCQAAGAPPETSAGMATAANMMNAALVGRAFRGVEVFCLATAGVEGNAGRAGDPATHHEHDGRFEDLTQDGPPAHGTINLMFFLGQELTAGGMVRAVITATEAKAVALQELAIGSRYSSGPATGTGTDQIIIAARLGGPPATSPSKHTKLGQLIAESAIQAIKDTLAVQNDLSASGQCSCRAHLARFAAGRDLAASAAALLDGDHAALLRQNFDVIDRDPPTVAAAAALAHVADELAWGVLPASAAPEILAAQAAQMAVAACGAPELWPLLRQRLAPPMGHAPEQVFDLACQALALGFAHKWR